MKYISHCFEKDPQDALRFIHTSDSIDHGECKEEILLGHIPIAQFDIEAAKFLEVVITKIEQSNKYPIVQNRHIHGWHAQAVIAVITSLALQLPKSSAVLLETATRFEKLDLGSFGTNEWHQYILRDIASLQAAAMATC